MTPDEAALMALVGGALEVHQDGTIWRMAQRGRTGHWRSIEPRRADEVRPDGYRRVRMQMDGRTVSAAAHRLVWLTFVGPIPDGLEPNHKNGDRGDNHPSNLELLTHLHNTDTETLTVQRLRTRLEQCRYGHRRALEQIGRLKARIVELESEAS